jgi:D-glycero-beta-D-manno-heptose 1-phosphate adenylyltransferase
MILTKLEYLSELRSNNPDSSIVMVNGAFDLFHVSHLEMIKQAKKKGDLLVVCLTSDRSLKKGKGKDRPVIPQKDRAAIVDSISYVDYVFLNQDSFDTELKNWPGYHLRPNLIISGDKRWYHTDPRVKELGIDSLLIKRGNISSSDIIKRIKLS